MSRLTETLRASRVFNTWDLLRRFGDKGKDIAVSYSTGSTVGVHGTKVFSPSHETCPGAPWYDYNTKRFTGKRTESLEPALAWAQETYGISEWVVCPFDRYAMVPAYVRERAEAWAKGAGGEH